MSRSAAELDRDINQALRAEKRGDYPDDLIPGDVVVRRDIRGRSKYVVSHTGKSAGFVQVYTRKVGGGGGIVTFDRSQLRMA